MRKFLLGLALVLSFPIGMALSAGNELAYFGIAELEALAAADVAVSGDLQAVLDATDGKAKKIPAYPTGRATIWICGDATTVNNNTVYYGPSQVVVAGAGRTCNIAQTGNTTEATADTPAFPAAFQVISWYCLQPDAGADLTYTLRNNAAAMVPAQAITIADNGLHGSSKTGTTTAIAANNPISIAVSSASDVGTAQFACALNIAF